MNESQRFTPETPKKETKNPRLRKYGSPANRDPNRYSEADPRRKITEIPGRECEEIGETKKSGRRGKKKRDGGREERKRGNELRLVQILMWREAHLLTQSFFTL